MNNLRAAKTDSISTCHPIGRNLTGRSENVIWVDFVIVKSSRKARSVSQTTAPIGFNGGDTNLYGYVVNDPINFVDSSGLNPIFSGLIGAVAGVVVGGISATANGTDPIEGAIIGAITGFGVGSGAALFGMGAVQLGIGAKIFSSAAGGALGGFKLNIVGQVAVTGSVDLPQAFAAFFFGGLGSALPPLLGGSIAADVAASSALRPYEIGADIILNQCRKARTK